MLTIRKEQIVAFEDQSLKTFEDDMVQHLKNFTPKQFETIGELSVREIIRLGIKRAEKYDFTYRGSVQFYIEMMFMFGSDFDTDPQYPWIIKVLNEGSGYDQMDRADQLHEDMIQYIEKVVGAEAEYELAALQKVTKLQFKDLLELNSEYPEAIVKELKSIYPQKCDFLGDTMLSKLHWIAYLYAKNNSLIENGGISVLFALMFTFGHGCTNDLQYPWIFGTLRDSSLKDSGRKIEKLHLKMMTFLNQVLKSY